VVGAAYPAAGWMMALDHSDVGYARIEYALGRYEVDGWNLAQIGEALQVSRERVRQLIMQGQRARDGRLTPLDECRRRAPQ
jgi:hypothetical protein